MLTPRGPVRAQNGGCRMRRDDSRPWPIGPTRRVRRRPRQRTPSARRPSSPCPGPEGQPMPTSHRDRRAASIAG
eukprot:6486222-Prymnesium_polylepis.1